MNNYNKYFIINRRSFNIIPALMIIIILLSFTVNTSAQLINLSLSKEFTIKAPITKLDAVLEADQSDLEILSKGWYEISKYSGFILELSIDYPNENMVNFLNDNWIKGKENGFDKRFKKHKPRDVLSSAASIIINFGEYYKNNPLKFWGYSDFSGGVISLTDWRKYIQDISPDDKIIKTFDSLFTKKDLTYAMNESIRWAKYIKKILNENVKLPPTPTKHKVIRNLKNDPGILSLPKGKTITVTVTRKKKKIDLTKIDISGCWQDDKGRNIIIKQIGTKVNAIYSKFGKRKFKGLLKDGKVSLLYVFKNVNDYASIPWTWDDPNQQASKKVLKQALVEQAKHKWGFELKVKDEDNLSGKMLGHHITWEGGKLTDFSAKKYKTTWKRRKVKLSSITITDETFKKKLSETSGIEGFWIKAIGSSGCSNFVDRVTVEVYTKKSIILKKKVELIETGPNTLEFHSLEAFSSFSFVIPAIAPDKIVVHAGLRGTTINLVDSKGKTPKEILIEEKRQIEIKLKKIEEKITQYNLYPDAFGQGLKETLQKELEHIEELILEQMRAKNELLMQYPNADVSAYDNDIKDLKIKRNSVKKQLKDLDTEIGQELKNLKNKKIKLEKRLKEIIKELNY